MSWLSSPVSCDGRRRRHPQPGTRTPTTTHLPARRQGQSGSPTTSPPVSPRPPATAPCSTPTATRGRDTGRQAGPLRAREGGPVQPALHPAVHARRRHRRRPDQRSGDLLRETPGDADRRSAQRPGRRRRPRQDGAPRSASERSAAETRRSSSRAFVRPTRCATTRSNDFVPCGAVAGVFARTDAQRGVWKAPAGLDASLVGVAALDRQADRRRERRAQPARRQLPAHVPGRAAASSGARARCGAPTSSPTSGSTSRCAALALFIEESLYRGTQWVVFEPNDEPLWAQIRLNVGAFMHNLFRQGAFQGTHAARGLLRQVRQGDDDAERHQPRHRQHRRRLRAAQAGRVRRSSRSSRSPARSQT